tara:strand:+ start:474 stop:1544 length:1071 start_codon:yes stop_codon:yes gene_type:complete
MALNQVGLERLNTATTEKIGKRKNIIINGDFKVAQRGTSSTSGGYQTVDRYRCNNSGVDEAPTQAQHALTSSDTGPYQEGLRFSFHVTNGNQTSGAGADDVIELLTKLEARDIANSGWDYKSSSSYLTLSFWVKSSVAQNFFGYLKTADGTAQNFPFQTGSLSADTWTKITKKIPGNSNLDFDSDATGGRNEGLRIVWGPFYGTNRTDSGVALDTWAAYASSTQTPDYTSTWYTTNNSTFEITGVQLELGSVVTDFEHRSFEEELALCQRYFQHIGKDTDIFFTTYTPGNFNPRMPFSFPQMRVAPTAVLSQSTNTNGTISFSAINTNSLSINIARSGSTVGIMDAEFDFTLSSEL